MTDQGTGDRGFGAMDEQEQREIARKGGEAAASQNERDEQGRFESGGPDAATGKAPMPPDSGSERSEGSKGSEGKIGTEFIKHEFDEAIAIQQAMVEAERTLAGVHPFAQAKSAIESYLAEDEQFLEQLRTLGEAFGATGKAEDVASSMQELATQTTEKAEQAESEAYEAHAVLVSLKRKQADSGAAMAKIGEATHDANVREAAQRFFDGQRASGQALADILADFAVVIATREA
jgi:general stress protein YciG